MQKKIAIMIAVVLCASLSLFTFSVSAAVNKTNIDFTQFDDNTEVYVKGQNGSNYSIGSLFVTSNKITMNRNQPVPPNVSYAELFISLNGNGVKAGGKNESITIQFNGTATEWVEDSTLSIYAVFSVNNTEYTVLLLDDMTPAIYTTGFTSNTQVAFAGGDQYLKGFRFVYEFSALDTDLGTDAVINMTTGWFESSADPAVEAIQKQTDKLLQAQQEQTSEILGAIQGNVTDEQKSQTEGAIGSLEEAASQMQTSKPSIEEMQSMTNIDGFIDAQVNAQYGNLFKPFYNNYIISAFLTIVTSMALISYLFFGKKG